MTATAGDVVQIIGGFIEGDPGFGPIPDSLCDAYGYLVASGEQVTEVVDGANYGSYSRRTLAEPVDVLKLKITSEGEWNGALLSVDGLVWRKLSPLEALALQQE